MFVAEAAGYSFPTQFLVVAWKNLVTYLSAVMSHEYLVRCYHRIIILLKPLYRECTVNSPPVIHIYEWPH
jgi:hypothetical protein